MPITLLPVEGFAANSYLLTKDGHGILVDAGVSEEALEAELQKENVTLERILMTHGHFDHLLSADRIRGKWQVPLAIHKDDAAMLTDGSRNASYTFFRKELVWHPAEEIFDTEDFSLEGDVIHVYHTPGHTQGSVCYRIGNDLFTGDTLFSGGVGRCDLWGGDKDSLVSSLMLLSELPGDLFIHPGHGPGTTLRKALESLSLFM